MIACDNTGEQLEIVGVSGVSQGESLPDLLSWNKMSY